MTPERRLAILTGTRALIADKRRWGKGRLMEHPLVDKLMVRPPSLCVMGAVMVATTGQIDYSAEVYEVMEFLGELVPAKLSAHGSPVTAYNDRVSTTHADVLFLLDHAIFVTETELHVAASEDEQHESDDRQDDQNRPQHESDSTPSGWEPCVTVDCPPVEPIVIDVIVPAHHCEPGTFAREVAQFYGDG